MTRLVCDTNIYVSAYNFGGVAKEVLLRIRSRSDLLFISEPILRELRRVLERKFGWSEERVRELLRNIKDYSILVRPSKPLRVVKVDPADDRILECALAARVDLIVTGDQDLLELEQFRGIRLLTPRQFLNGYPLRKAA